MQKLLLFITWLGLNILSLNQGLTTETTFDENKLHLEIRDYILNNPELIIEAIKIYEQIIHACIINFMTLPWLGY